MAKRIILAAVVLLPLAACQSGPPEGRFQPICSHRAYDAGRCEQPSDLNLFGALVAQPR